jgi:phage repressor protein C with HTH and peptisase S24 domain
MDSSSNLKQEIGQRIKDARAALTLTQKEFCILTGMKLPSLRDYELGNRIPGGEAVVDLARARINANWLLTGIGEMFLGDAPFGSNMVGAEHNAGEPTPPPYGFVLVPRYDVAASMGNGSVIHSEQIVDHLAFREEWVRTELGASPKNLVLISAIGDSMEPTLRAGDLLLIDRSTAGVKQDAIYAFATNGELRVKRMQLKIDGRLVVKSDNPQYEAEILDASQAEHLKIVGRVVWSGRRM